MGRPFNRHQLFQTKLELWLGIVKVVKDLGYQIDYHHNAKKPVDIKRLLKKEGHLIPPRSPGTFT